MTAEDLGPLLGAIPVAAIWFAREWWKARSASRADAVDSANAKGQINMLADYERRAKEAEAEADMLRNENRKLDRISAEQEGDLRSARRVIKLMSHRLKQAGVPDSERDALMTDFGNFTDARKP